MHIQSLVLRDFRNYEEQEIEFAESVNVFVGENAQGKTNALEAICLLAVGKSHRTNRDSDCIRWGADSASVRGIVHVRNHPQRLEIELRPGAKKASVNGVHLGKMTDFVGHFQIVLFAPEDLMLVKGSPGGRRRFIDMELGQTQPKYLYHLVQYQRVLQQRNALLKQGVFDADMMDIIDEQLADHGSEILLRRLRFIESLRDFAGSIYASIADGREELALRYVSTVVQDGAAAVTRGQLIDDFLRILRAKRQSDVHAGHTTVGPHRDDIEFELGGQSVQSFASQGQQRTIALALRLAEIDFIHQEIGDYPVLLLDDVLSELDDLRQRNLVLTMSHKVQTIITTTSLFQLREKLHSGARLFQVRSGIIQKEG